MKKIIALLLALVLSVSMLAGCGTKAAEPEAPAAEPAAEPAETPAEEPAQTESAVDAAPVETEPEATVSAPKYVFLFIGDGMSYPQFQATSDYLGALADDDYMLAVPSLDDNQGAVLDGPEALNFMNFAVAGSAVTYDSNSFAPDSASTATSIATGHKTYSGSINVDETSTVEYETIAEKVHSQLGMKVGIISSVNLNHATPAAFYAHQASRSSYYEIGEELIASNFEYFAGGGLLKPTGKEGDQENLYDLAETAGYTVVYTQDEAEAVTAGDGKVILIDEHLADAVQAAVDFAKDHAGETLILVTGDHETGGLTIGFAGTDYDTYLSLLESQKISFAKYDSDYVTAYKENQTDFDTVLADIETLFGLKTEGGEDDKLVLTDYELSQLETAYEKSIHEQETGVDAQQEYVMYGTYEPLTVTITHILNNKSGVSFTSYSHTGLPVAVFADGVHAEDFKGYFDNTEIYNKLAAMLGVQ